MSEAVLRSAAAPQSRRALNPWIIALIVVIPTFREVLDTTIANVALRYIAGGLSATVSDGEWVVTSYLAANAIILPLSGWLGSYLGRRNYFILSIAVFTISSGLCGMATSLGQLIFFRVLQGLAGGGLQPSTQGVLLDTFPQEKQGMAMTVFGLAAVVAPILGPTLGGWITDNYSWRWIFFINLPVGGLALLASYLTLQDPEYLKQQRSELLSKPLNFDSIGLSLLVITMVCWEVVLSKGQEWDWFGDAFHRVHVLAGLFVICLAGLLYREATFANPIINFRPLKERNLAACSLITFSAFAVLYGSTTSLPGLLQSLFGYDATHSGLVMSPSGVASVMLLPIIGALLGRGTDARWLIVTGLSIMTVANFWMAHVTLDISPFQVVLPRIVLIVGLSFIFAPLNVAAYMYTPQKWRGAAVGLLSLLRNEGGSVGTSFAQTMQERRSIFHGARLNDYLDPFNPAVTNFTSETTANFLTQTGDPVQANQMAMQSLDNLRLQQASSLGYFDSFWLFGVLCGSLLLLIFLMKRSVAQKGAHISAE